jgi:hypothetical protein
MKSKWHNISIQTKSFEDLQGIQKLIPIRVSIPQTIEWLIKVGQAQIIQTKSETNGKLQLRVSDLERDNKILSKQISDSIKNHEGKFRKAGL